jgi:Fe-S-cluster-containing dehydrogenase component
MKWGMVVDLSKRVRCYGCVVGGRVKHFLPIGHDWTQIMAMVPD